MRWLRKKAEYINGYRVRHRNETCPLCAAPPTKWCDAGCKALDLMDYR